jgi:hypothetical protein
VHNARAVVLLHDQFLENGVLVGKVPMPGPGGAWDTVGGAAGVNAITVVNGEVVLIQTDGDTGGVNGEDMANVFGDQSATATTYARFDFRLPALENATVDSDPDVTGEGVFLVTIRGSSASTTQRARVGVLGPGGGGNFRFAINADNSNIGAGAIWPSDLAFDTTYRAVISFDASNAQSRLWIDPANEMSASVLHTGDPLSIGTILNRIVLRQHTDYSGKQFIDNVVVATTFGEALNPEPSGNGDFNGDGFVDAADYVVWRKSDGSPDGYDEWRANFGSSVVGSGNSAVSGVPEPVSAILLTISLALLGIYRLPRE